MTMPLISSYATPDYTAEAESLVKTLDSFNLRHFVSPMEDHGSWRLNCGRKPQFLKDVMRDLARGPVVWLDADARVLHRPALFEELAAEWDFAAFFIPHRYMQQHHVPGGGKNDGIASGTMWFNDTAGGRLLLDTWIEIDHGQHDYEQMVLGEAWLEVRNDIRTFRLPQSYCKVFDCQWFKGEKGPTVIEHTQASRRLRRRRR